MKPNDKKLMISELASYVIERVYGDRDQYGVGFLEDERLKSIAELESIIDKYVN